MHWLRYVAGMRVRKCARVGLGSTDALGLHLQTFLGEANFLPVYLIVVEKRVIN